MHTKSSQPPQGLGGTPEPSASPRKNALESLTLPDPVPDLTLTGLAGGLEAVEISVQLPAPPQRAFRSDKGETVFEALTLVGWVQAPRSARASLDLYGIDMSLAHYDFLKHRWEGCFFSEEVADMLVELAAEGQFPYPFEAVPSWATLDRWVRESRGEGERRDYEIYYYCEPASQEAIRAWVSRTGKDPVRRATSSEVLPEPGNEEDGAPWLRTRY